MVRDGELSREVRFQYRRSQTRRWVASVNDDLRLFRANVFQIVNGKWTHVYERTSKTNCRKSSKYYRDSATIKS